MTPIPVPVRLTRVLWGVGMHGCTDACTHRSILPAYIGALVPWPGTSTLLTILSTVHFSEDIGPRKSVMLHLGVVALAKFHVPAAVATIATYMVLVHVPLHMSRVRKYAGEGVTQQLCAVTAVAALCGPKICTIPDIAQRIACVHIALHTRWPLSEQISGAGS